MLTPSDITLPGFYWYFLNIPGADPVIVEIGPEGAPKRDLQVHFTGREDWDMLNEISGSFIGPLTPPAG